MHDEAGGLAWPTYRLQVVVHTVSSVRTFDEECPYRLKLVAVCRFVWHTEGNA